MNTQAPAPTEMIAVTHDRFWDFVNVHDLYSLPIFNNICRGHMYLDADNKCLADMAYSRTDPDAIPIYRIRKL